MGDMPKDFLWGALGNAIGTVAGGIVLAAITGLFSIRIRRLARMVKSDPARLTRADRRRETAQNVLGWLAAATTGGALALLAFLWISGDMPQGTGFEGFWTSPRRDVKISLAFFLWCIAVGVAGLLLGLSALDAAIARWLARNYP